MLYMWLIWCSNQWGQGGQEHAQDNTYFEEVLTYLIVLIIWVKKMIWTVMKRLWRLSYHIFTQRSCNVDRTCAWIGSADRFGAHFGGCQNWDERHGRAEIGECHFGRSLIGERHFGRVQIGGRQFGKCQIGARHFGQGGNGGLRSGGSGIGGADPYSPRICTWIGTTTATTTLSTTKSELTWLLFSASGNEFNHQRL